MSKLDELSRLMNAGLPIPHFEKIQPETKLSTSLYGDYAVVKPSYELSSWGQGIELHRTETVQFRKQSEYPENHHGHWAPMFAQRYIDCGAPMTCRVLTLFGVPIFTYLREATGYVDLNKLNAPYEQTAYMPVDQDLKISITNDPDYLALATLAYQAIPDAALQACDILRDKEGKLHLLEVNPGGGTWMFSSKFASAYRQSLGVDDLTTQFDAFATCARLLVERTRAEAC